MTAERRVTVDHPRVHRWAIKILPVLATVFRRRKCPVGVSWRMDETCIKAAGQWKYLYRAGKRSAVLLSLIESAKLDGHYPWAYLKDVLDRLPTL